MGRLGTGVRHYEQVSKGRGIEVIGRVLSAYLLLYSGSAADAVPVERAQAEVSISCVGQGVGPGGPCGQYTQPIRHASFAAVGLGQPTRCVREINLSAVYNICGP